MTSKKSTRAKTTATASRRGAVKKTSTKKGSPARAALPLAWSGREYVPRKRWWWYVVLVWVTLTLALLLLALDMWSVSLLTVTIGIALFVSYLPKPPMWNYELTAKTLTAVRAHRRNAADEIRLNLADYRAFTSEMTPERADSPRRPFYVLLPNRRFAVAREIYLPDDIEQSVAIGAALETALPYQDDDPYTRSMRIVDRITRVLRLS